ncbi:hypothetical protein TPA0906_18860 [Streptomyces olivaceus]|nr:hypothetical protein TPA0906_18860 [Streptomyces olivaceus]
MLAPSRAQATPTMVGSLKPHTDGLVFDEQSNGTDLVDGLDCSGRLIAVAAEAVNCRRRRSR